MKRETMVRFGCVIALVAAVTLTAVGCDSTGTATTYVSVGYGYGYGPGWGSGWGGYQPGGGVVVSPPPVAVPY
ncbi:MAG: hypothetical protein PVG92_09020 [Holophagae bacterium]|jgi:hypothetical protein